MKSAVRSTSLAIGGVAVVGVSTLFAGVVPANAADSATCGVGTLVAPGVCEQTFTDTSAAATFTPTASMTKLQVLLVGAGASGYGSITGNGALAGGGGEVRIVDFSGATTPLTVNVPTSTAPGGVTGGTPDGTVLNGNISAFLGASGGASGNGNSGGSGTTADDAVYGGGGGAGAAATSTAPADGGAGAKVNTIPASARSIAGATSLFASDTNCYGGGGAAAVAGTDGATQTPPVTGTATCGGAVATSAAATAVTDPAANSGGGGAAADADSTTVTSQGASGLVVFRWTATPVTLTFDTNNHGTVASETVVPGTAPIKPADPTADGFTFGGWFTDPGLTTPADFTQPLVADTVFYAKFTPVLAATGVPVSPLEIGVAGGAVVLGGLLAGFAAVRRRRRTE